MFIGHFAVGFASKKLAPRAPLLLLMTAPLLLDMLWPLFLLAGWESVRIAPGDTAFTPLEFVSYPFSHSLLFALVWALLLAIPFLALSRYPRGALVVAAGVLSHWFLDALTHRPDMPVYPGGPRVGLGLWNSVGGTVVVECLMFAAGVWAYLAATRPRDRIGTAAFGSLVIVLLVLYIADIKSAPPPNVRVLAWVALAGWIFPLWAGWADRHRSARSDPA